MFVTVSTPVIVPIIVAASMFLMLPILTLSSIVIIPMLYDAAIRYEQQDKSDNYA
jgi:hypothetical protein